MANASPHPPAPPQAGIPHTRMLYSAAEVRALDRVAIDVFGIPGGVLMRRAGGAALEALLARWPQPGTLHICCGTGNNGGDGFVLAALARARGLTVKVWQVGDPARIAGAAKVARESMRADGVEIRPLQPDSITGPGVVVDGLLGTGLSGEVRPAVAAAIDSINASRLPVLALDIPSGLCGDSGRVLGRAVRADLTATFIGIKRGLLTGEGPACAGQIRFDDLRVPPEIYQRVPLSARWLDLIDGAPWLSPRPRTAHKGAFGHVLVIGGDHGMAGAPAMAAQAAARTGAGLISCATRPEHLSALVARCPEVMVGGVTSGQELEPLLDRASVVVIGPGLGRSAWSEQLLRAAWHSDLPLVADADALNLIAAGRVATLPRAAPWMMTPHPGEAARLLDVATAAVQADRFEAARGLCARYGATVVLKGAGTLVLGAVDATPGLCGYGNPGMASGGMGDVLSGVLGGLLAQGLQMPVAAELGVCLHAAAADRAAVDGERGLLATDLLVPLRRLVNEY